MAPEPVQVALMMLTSSGFPGNIRNFEIFGCDHLVGSGLGEFLRAYRKIGRIRVVKHKS